MYVFYGNRQIPDTRDAAYRTTAFGSASLSSRMKNFETGVAKDEPLEHANTYFGIIKMFEAEKPFVEIDHGG